MRLPTRILALVLAAACAATTHADIIYGNLAAYTNDLGNTSNGSSILGQQTNTSGAYFGKAIGFTMGADSYSVTSLTLRLGNITGTTDAPTISLWTNNGSNVPGAQVGTFTNPATFNGVATTNYVFTPASSITLSGGARYFIVVQQTSPFTGADNGFNWYFGSPSVAASGVASTTVVRLSNNTNTTSPTSFTDTGSTSVNWFQLDGTNLSAIPEPSTFAALAGLAVLGLAASRRRRCRCRG
jgi:hypothetical protein